MKLKIKKILFLIIVLAIVLPAKNVFAYEGYHHNALTAETKPMSIVTKWYYRDVKGGTQKRLWSVTEGKWLTDWMWV